MDDLISDLSVSNLPWERFDAVLFDLDGVLTATATVHATCWKRMFDEFLRQNAGRNNEPFEPFRVDEDYRLYVDGKPRFDGVRSFLRSILFRSHRCTSLADGLMRGESRIRWS